MFGYLMSVVMLVVNLLAKVKKVLVWGQGYKNTGAEQALLPYGITEIRQCIAALLQFFELGKEVLSTQAEALDRLSTETGPAQFLLDFAKIPGDIGDRAMEGLQGLGSAAKDFNVIDQAGQDLSLHINNVLRIYVDWVLWHLKNTPQFKEPNVQEALMAVDATWKKQPDWAAAFRRLDQVLAELE